MCCYLVNWFVQWGRGRMTNVRNEIASKYFLCPTCEHLGRKVGSCCCCCSQKREITKKHFSSDFSLSRFLGPSSFLWLYWNSINHFWSLFYFERVDKKDMWPSLSIWNKRAFLEVEEEKERGISFLAYDIDPLSWTFAGVHVRLLFKFKIISFWLKETIWVNPIK